MRERSPAAERNGPVLLEVLRAAVPPGARVLEIACGTGQHAALLAPGLAASSWVPTDLAPERFASVRAWTEGIAAVAAPRVLDARAPDSWPDIEVDLVLAVNMVHISPWAATLGLLAGDGGRITLPMLQRLPLISFDPSLRRLILGAAASRATTPPSTSTP